MQHQNERGKRRKMENNELSAPIVAKFLGAHKDKPRRESKAGEGKHEKGNVGKKKHGEDY